MNLPLIEMERPAAIKAFEAYRQAVRERHSVEDEQLMRGYRELAAGRRLIDLPRAMREAGTIEQRRVGGVGPMMLPKLAISRANDKLCYVDMRWDGGAWFGSRSRSVPRIGSGVTAGHVVLASGTFPSVSVRGTGRAIVPIIPPALRPARGLSGYHVLWEAEWERVAPLDPALLKHVGGDLWAVIATWDLTELERAVVMGRGRSL